MIRNYLVLLIHLVFVRGEATEWGYVATFNKNITHQRCYEGIGPEMIYPWTPQPPPSTWKARDCPAYSINCVKITMCKIVT